eukprot:gnl/MRDRNA2_/MRDRNA2_75349_c0_seq1.p1 gnl/MRDRNA2_/MRDRNA2_75349_c0~~gnl/MRDRNA2_/MRDRNA2_75349_c0_seq1.p1  ORF type:complete len:697 (+),score=158.91 gnl/MRDRNA2_/MRDRNA2_75349_c0_seq1:89-2179(+)
MSFETDDEADGEEYDDSGLSYVAEAARNALTEKHSMHRKRCWNVTHGKVVGEIKQTPPKATWGDLSAITDDPDSHSDYFPQNMFDVITRAQEWVDITSLSQPDGKFTSKFAEAIQQLHESGNEITIRLLVGNIIGMPTDCDAVVEMLTKDLPTDSNIKLYVGAWREGVSWNHSKIIAVDGKYLFEGGHNLWDAHYLQTDPVHDLSMEAEGQVAMDGHVFANKMWGYVRKIDEDYWLRRMAPDWVPLLVNSRVNFSQWPKVDTAEYPPMYSPASQPLPLAEAVEQGDLPMLTMGRYGAIHSNEGANGNPSDSAIVAMFESAQKIIRLSLQDLGPLTMPTPGALRAIPGGVWPEAYLRALGLAIYQRGVDVEIVLSNPFACPGKLSPLTANYGNGWTTTDVAAEIIKAILKNVEEGEVDDEKLRQMVQENLRVTTMCIQDKQQQFPEGSTVGNHSKFFIVDDLCYYIGSQNLYICNLAEWGIIIDNEEQTQKVMEEYWNPMWEQSYRETATNVDDVMDGLNIDRTGCAEEDASEEDKVAALKAKRANAGEGHPNALAVLVKRAENLKDSDGLGGGTSDSYARLRIVDGDGNTIVGPRKTSVKKDGGPNPEWNELITFEGLDTPEAYTLKITVLDYDDVLGVGWLDFADADDKLGAADFALGELDKSEEFQEKELTIGGGVHGEAVIVVGLSNKGEWGN